MKRYITFLFVAAIMAVGQSFGGVTLTVPDVTIAPGSTANVIINYDLGSQAYTAFQMDIAYPEGINSVSGGTGNPAFIKGDVYSDSHNVSSIYTSAGLDRFQCFSVDSDPLTSQSGTLLILPIKAQKSLAEGTYQATISPIEFVQTDATPDRPEAITFNIIVSKYVVLDETSTVAPTAATGVDVTVRRTIKANVWSTIVLPFGITASQMQTAFGDDVAVELADFTGYEAEETNGNLTGISVKFSSTTAISANRPCIIRVSKPVTEINVKNVNIEPEDNPTVATVTRTRRQWSELIGTYIANTVVPENTLFLNDNKFYYSTGLSKMKAFRAYFDFYDVLTAVENYGVKMFIDGLETKVDEIGFKDTPDSLYDLSGRKVTKPQQSAVYIVNGKKAVIK